MKTIYELMPTNGRKSFYGKARVIIDGETQYLQSYNTIVASIKGGELFRHWSGWSVTTGNHLRAFAGINKKEWEAMPVAAL